MELILNIPRNQKYFVEKVSPLIPLDAIINPAKKYDKYAPDLLINGKIADLKTQNTPFFTAEFLYNIPAQYTVTFNKKDYERYTKLYPNILVVFWVSWNQTAYKELCVSPMAGIWICPFSELSNQIRTGNIHLHEYKRRVGDMRGNARESYVFDLRNFVLLKRFI